MSEIILKYFPDLDDTQKERFLRLEAIYKLWNARINVISRKDIGNFYVHHVLHSLSIAKVINFSSGTRILDAGTGGGFPGIPLAIMFPSSAFTLLDSIEKKIRVVSAVVSELSLKNVNPVRKRVEEETGKFDYIVSRAVSALPGFVKLTDRNISEKSQNTLPNGIFYLKGGDLIKELQTLKTKSSVWNISDFFTEPYFETKKIVFIPSGK